MSKRINPQEASGFIIPKWLMDMSGMNHGSKMCLAIMYQQANEDGYCTSKPKPLAHELHVTTRTIRTYLNTLTSHGFIEAVNRSHIGETPLYYFLDHPAMHREGG